MVFLEADRSGPYPAVRPDARGLVETSGPEVLSQVNARVTQLPQAPIIVALTVFAVPAVVFFDSLTALYIAAVGLLIAYLFHNGDLHKRTSFLSYRLTDEAARQYALMQTAFQSLAKANCTWQVRQETSVAQLKKNAGDSSTVVRSPAHVTSGAPPWIKTNVTIWAIDLGKSKLYFFPDRLLLWDSRRYQAISYDSLGVGFAPTRYVEDGKPPLDSEVVDRAWRYMTEKGEADERYISNTQFPVVVYGSLLFGTQNRLIVHLYVSNAPAAAKFAEIFRSSVQPTSARTDSHATSSASRDFQTSRSKSDKRPRKESRRPRVQGRVKWFNREGGVGVIGAQFDEELHLHASQILEDGLEFLREGTLVEFEVGQGAHGPIAANVAVLGRNRAGGMSAGTESAPPWDVLGVAFDASDEEITAAYRRMAQMYHPDKVNTLGPELKEMADRRMKEINIAYDALKRN